MLAHDLRNHLTPLQGRLDLIRRRAMREGCGEYLRDSEHAVRTVDRLRRLIDDLLDVSRLERGLFFINLRPIDVAGGWVGISPSTSPPPTAARSASTRNSGRARAFFSYGPRAQWLDR